MVLILLALGIFLFLLIFEVRVRRIIRIIRINLLVPASAKAASKITCWLCLLVLEAWIIYTLTNIRRGRNIDSLWKEIGLALQSLGDASILATIHIWSASGIFVAVLTHFLATPIITKSLSCISNPFAAMVEADAAVCRVTLFSEAGEVPTNRLRRR